MRERGSSLHTDSDAFHLGERAQGLGGPPKIEQVERELLVVIRGLGSLVEQAAAEPDGVVAGSEGVVDRSALETGVRVLAERIRKNDPEAEVDLEKVRKALAGTRASEMQRIARALDVFDFRGAAQALGALAEVEGIRIGMEG